MDGIVGFTPKKWAQALLVFPDLPMELWNTFYVTMLATLIAVIIGLPLGVLLVVGEKDSVLPLPGWLMKALNVLINLLRSVPFLILIVVVIPLTKAILGTFVGNTASVVPLAIASFPFVARLTESSLREVNPNIIETAQSMGATPLQIIVRVLLPESVPSLLTNFTLAITTIMGYTAMSGAIGGGGLGRIALTDGFARTNYFLLYAAVILLVVVTQVIQSLGTWIATKSDKRLKH